ncbi:sensor histidine kinase YesM [Wenyingzhuangia heitensis]|uniref:Sensor histidine kinase YesM n=1 Tax=Wenyingzhuangia heitensis TaxID=1487859 RepID=A0ABX0UC64_9FLAO|nr:histidine kinase [Wenyingzhuangia heitensis]NIJ46408.1 sensor histidine kinase YesM [Wenyingzhuangia heitensis]
MNKYLGRIIQNKWWQELFILLFSFLLFTLNDWILIKSFPSLLRGCIYFLLLYTHAQLNRIFLLPLLLKKHKPVVYFFSTVVLLCVFTVLTYYATSFWIYKNCFLYKSIAQKNLGFQGATLMVTLVCILSISLILKFYRNNKRLDKEKLLYNNVQLNSLKEQLNPHFLFNTFNTLYGISLKYPDRVSDLVMHVSQLMRYQLESSDAPKVLLEDEINFIRSYVLLEKERVGYRCYIKFNSDIAKENTYNIAPMLLITFVENAFKHGSATTENCFVKIDVRVEKNNLLFKVCNSIPKNKKEIVSTKIGLKNTLKRLELIYGEKYTIKITKEPDYNVVLKIKLD